MHLCELKLRDFRNYEELEFRAEPGVNLIVGDNAQGKTNLLEGLVYLGSGKSWRTQKSAELVRFGAAFADLEATVFSQEREQTLRTVVFPGKRPRQLWRNGVKKKSAAECAGVLNTVLFCPEDLLVLNPAHPQEESWAIWPCASSGPITTRPWRSTTVFSNRRVAF